jgi:hypothetical protein
MSEDWSIGMYAGPSPLSLSTATPNPVLALREPFHLSFPFVFEHRGEHYMVPETLARPSARSRSTAACFASRRTAARSTAPR